MERLTFRDERGKAWANLKTSADSAEIMDFGRKSLNCLAAYEDTGLSPADIADLTARTEKAKAERDKAAEFIRWVDDNFSHYMPQEYTDRLMALAGEVATGKDEND